MILDYPWPWPWPLIISQCQHEHLRRWLRQGLLSGRLRRSSCPPWEWPLRDRWSGQVITLASHWSILLILSSHWSAGDTAAPMRDTPGSTPGQRRENTYCIQYIEKKSCFQDNIQELLDPCQHRGNPGEHLRCRSIIINFGVLLENVCFPYLS